MRIFLPNVCLPRGDKLPEATTLLLTWNFSDVCEITHQFMLYVLVYFIDFFYYESV